jgi:hypothetical protein
MENHFIPLQSLAQQLTDQLNHLYSGQYKKESLESMVSNARDLYERLVVLRHKAYEQEVNAQTVEEAIISDVSFELPTFTLDLSDISENNTDTPSEPELNPAHIESMVDQRQVNLMDMIEEVTKSDNSLDMETAESFIEESTEPTLSEPTPIVSLNDILSQNQNTSTILNRLEKSKIDDLKKSITMNQRFQFARELFNGDSEQYEITISALNNCEPEKALELLQSNKQKWSWDETSIAFIELLDLVQRRHEI